MSMHDVELHSIGVPVLVMHSMSMHEVGLHSIGVPVLVMHSMGLHRVGVHEVHGFAQNLLVWHKHAWG
jgi:hypothetical protein